MKNATHIAVGAFIRTGISDPSERDEALQWWNAYSQPPKKDRLLKTRDAARLAEVTPRTLRDWERQGHLHPRHITPRRVRWSLNELQNFLCLS